MSCTSEPASRASATPSHAERFATPAPASTACAFSRVDALGEVARAPHRRALPRVHGGVEVRHVVLAISAPRVGRRFCAQRRDAIGTESLEPLVLRLDVEHPVPDPFVVAIASGRVTRLDPEVVVLAVTADRQGTGVQPAGVRAHRCLDDREHPMGRDANEMRPRTQVVDDPLDGDDDTSLRGERPPHTLEQGRMERDVARTVRDRRVQESHVRLHRRQQTNPAEGGLDLA